MVERVVKQARDTARRSRLQAVDSGYPDVAGRFFGEQRRLKDRRHEVAEEKEKTLKPLWLKGFLLVEHRRFELLTPTLPVLCATNCANAPRFSVKYHNIFPVSCKALFCIFYDDF